MTQLPPHNRPTPDRAARAPYNFVPLPDKVATVDLDDLPGQDSYHTKDRYTGWLDCTLTTASPLYVRAALEPDEFERSLNDADEKKKPWREQVRNKPDFFYTEAGSQAIPRPVIPGSTLRGMLRTMVEIAGYGKVPWVSDKRLVYRAVGDTTRHGERYRHRLMQFDGEGRNEKGKGHHYRYTPLMQAGYMEELPGGDWAIRPAKNIGGTTFARIANRFIPDNLKPWHNCKNAREIWVQAGPYQYQKVRGGFIRTRYAKVLRAAAQSEAGLIPATLAMSGWIPNKNSEAVVFEADPDDRRLIKIDDDLLQAYRQQVADVFGGQRRKGRRPERILGPQGVLQPGSPVFYLEEEGKLVFFGHCMMFRIPYLQSPLSFVPEDLRRETDIDLAEAIFGYTKRQGEGKARSYAGRVFVSDAQLSTQTEASSVWVNDTNPIIPPILGGPKPTTFQHYLTQRHPNPITVEGQQRASRSKTQVVLEDYAGNTPEDVVIRGHKLYWHKKLETLQQIQESQTVSERDTQHTHIRPVKEGVQFKFRVRFENLAPRELGALLWVLDIARDEKYRLKLGMGKPYGLGAVQIQGDLHIEDRQTRYRRLFNGTAWATPLQPDESTWTEARQAFETFVLTALAENKDKPLAELGRVQELLSLLTWPGPDLDYTRYMEIERKDPKAKRGKVNEYRDRPVLPAPTDVLSGQAYSRAKHTPTSRRPQPNKIGASGPDPKSEPRPAQPKDVPQVGEIFMGVVLNVFSSGNIMVQYKKVPSEHVTVIINKEDLEGKQYAPGHQIRCKILSVTQSSANIWSAKGKRAAKKPKK